MRLDDVLFEELVKRLLPRKILFTTRAKLYIHFMRD